MVARLVEQNCWSSDMIAPDPAIGLSPFRLREAGHAIRAGAVVAYPTEAVYGLGCDPLNAAAVQRLLAIKGRPLHKGVILIAAELRQLSPFMAPLAAADLATLQADWPGPVTWVVPAAPDLPPWLSGGRDTVAVRVTAHPLAAALCRAAGMPLVSTSANASGRPPARTALQARLRCPGVDLVLAGATGGRKRPTEIRDLASGRRLRQG
jgi:L-threonylcarbamoyladenylate synthase